MSHSLIDTIHQYSLMGIYWSILVSCRRSTSLECTTQLPCFYAHRVWIITGKNRLITRHDCEITFSLFHTKSAEVLFSTKLSPASTFASAICDIFITGTVWLFMIRSKYYINELMWIFIDMGLFSCLVAITMAVLVSPAVHAKLGKSGSRLLNARKSIRERERLACNVTELPTIRTIR
ncbi:uncharacterized protein EDB91DRAFT_1163257 [Suillus paluster]|uniref:uncharacterized protein n=1 Tax=Suillus paluster TaxID=48578 RepID=UPI001B86E8B3|nr:uncharacterized protein EDB91DRAFT_1163257 [Suillus paluster]KAG1727785.1 hypothetical protein EDB91DRAFT_1163257 [Suillus paluster]